MQVFRTIKGFICLPDEWRSKDVFDREQIKEIEKENILVDGIPALINEYGLCGEIIRENSVAVIDESGETILYLDGDKKILGYIYDFGYYEAFSAILFDIAQDEYMRVFYTLASANGQLRSAAKELTKSGWIFSKEKSKKDTDGYFVFEKLSAQLLIKFNSSAVATEFVLKLKIGEFIKDLKPEDYNVTDEYAKIYMNLGSETGSEDEKN